MKKRLSNKLVIISVLVLIISLLIAILPRNQPEEDTVFTTYQELQEEIINEEENKRMLFQKNTDLIKKIHSLQKNIDILVSDIETKNKKIQMEEIPHPQDRISEDQIDVTGDRIILNIKNANWWHMIDSNSMDPLLDEGSSIIAIKPSSENDIKIGDILVFNINTSEYDVVHRVMNISEDESGIYFITKGDNVLSADSSRVRYESVIAVVVGILY